MVGMATLLGTAVAQATTLRIDPDTTAVSFVLESTLHTVHGTLGFESGWVTWDPKTGAATGEVVLDVLRAESGNAKRDRKMHEKVLESGRFPKIVFRPTQVEGQVDGDGEHELRLRGVVELKEKRHEVELEAVVSRTGSEISATGTIVIPYVAWGLKDPSVFIFRAGKEVSVGLAVHGVLEP